MEDVGIPTDVRWKMTLSPRKPWRHRGSGVIAPLIFRCTHKIGKSTISFVICPSVRPSVRMELGFHWTDFHYMRHFSICINLSRKVEFHSDRKRMRCTLREGYFTRRILYVKGTLHEGYVTWRVLYVKGTLHEGYFTWRVLYMKGILREGYFTWRVLYVKGILREGYFTWRVLYMKVTLHEDHQTFSIISRSVLLRMKNISDITCTESQSTHFMSNNFFLFRKSCRFLR